MAMVEVTVRHLGHGGHGIDRVARAERVTITRAVCEWRSFDHTSGQEFQVKCYLHAGNTWQPSIRSHAERPGRPSRRPNRMNAPDQRRGVLDTSTVVLLPRFNLPKISYCLHSLSSPPLRLPNS